MEGLKKYSPSSLINIVFKPRFRAYYFAKQCDVQSACAVNARSILMLLEKKKNIAEQNARIKEEIFVMLDHEKLMTQFRCNALASLTIRELLRQMLQQKSPEDLIFFVEDIAQEIERNYSPTIPKIALYYLHHDYEDSRDATSSTGGSINLQALIHKHMGQGVEYLRELHKSSARTF